MTKEDTVATLPLEELEQRVTAALADISAIEERLPGLVAVTADDRLVYDGRLRAGEADALAAVLDVADAVPSAFLVLADKDDGSDPKRFETDLLRDRFARVLALESLATELEDLLRDIRDTQLALGGSARRVALAAYEIAKPLAKSDPSLRAKLTKASEFYAAPARQTARTRAEKKLLK